jgi:ADP-heptose:LPS heptosyltransferase
MEDDYILVHPTAAWPEKFWTAKGWQAVVEHIRRRYGFKVVLTGGSNLFEEKHLREITTSELELIDFSGKTNLQEFIYLIANARSVVAIDGAASHLARAFNKPVVTLFGHTNPLKWTTETRPWQRIVKSDADDKGHGKVAATIPAAQVTDQLDWVLVEFKRTVNA